MRTDTYSTVPYSSQKHKKYLKDVAESIYNKGPAWFHNYDV